VPTGGPGEDIVKPNTMHISANEIYHVYNQGNNGEHIFYSDADYLEFLRLFRKHVFNHCKVLAWCLMPNHFHFLLYVSQESAIIKRIGNIDSTVLSNGFRLLQSRYAQYLNKKRGRTGSLFRQKTKAKALSEGTMHYGFIAFQYIHQNPWSAGLVQKLEDWAYSSYCDFAGLRKGNLCDLMLAEQIIGFDKNNFVAESYKAIGEEFILHLFEDSKLSI
jgi:putative transposase